MTLTQDVLEAADVKGPRAGLRKGGVNETSWSLRWGQVQRREGKQKWQDSHHPCPRRAFRSEGISRDGTLRGNGHYPGMAAEGLPLLVVRLATELWRAEGLCQGWRGTLGLG